MTTSIGAGATYSDNALKQPDGLEVSDVWYSPFLDVDYNLEFTSLTANLTYRVERTIYSDETSENRNDVLGESNIDWSLIANRLNWNLRHIQSRLTIDSLEPAIPANTTRRDIVQTGPSLNFNFGNTRVELTGTVARAEFERDELRETDQQFYRALISRQFGGGSTVGLLYAYTEVDYDEDVLDYSTRRLSVVARGTGRRFSYDVNVGRNRVERLTTRFEGTFVAASFAWQGNESTLRLSFNRELTDSSIGLALANGPGDALNPGDTNFDVTDIVDREHAEFEYRFNSQGRTSLAISASHDRQDFKTQPRDQTRTAVRAQVRYDLSPRLAALVSAEEASVDVKEGIDTGFDETTYRLEIEYRPNADFRLTLWSSPVERDDVNPGRDYKEWMSGVSFRYRI